MSNFVFNGMRVFARKFLIGASVVLVMSMGSGFTQPAHAGAYAIAKKYMGLHEAKHNGKLRKYLGINPRKTPWCGAFVGTVMKRAGKDRPSGYMRAASWKTSGKAVSLKNARKGDVVVVRTKRGHHVGFYSSRKNGKVQLLGGNQSNRVQISNYSVKSVQAVRRH